MWFLYVPLVTLVLVAIGSALFGVLPVTITAIVLAILLGVAVVAARSRSMRLTSVDSPGGIPSSREAGYDPRSQTTGTGGSTGTL